MPNESGGLFDEVCSGCIVRRDVFVSSQYVAEEFPTSFCDGDGDWLIFADFIQRLVGNFGWVFDVQYLLQLFSMEGVQFFLFSFCQRPRAAII